MSVSVKHGAWGWELGGCRSEVLAQVAHFSCPGPRHHRVQLFNAHNLGRGGTFTLHSTRRRRRRTRGGSHTYATLPATPSFFLPLPRSAKAAALHQGFEGHQSLHSVCLGPCQSPPIGAQSALLAQSRAKTSNNPSTPFSIKENASKTAPP